MLHGIYLALSGLKLVSKVKREIVALTPDELYKRFIELSSLSPDTTTWPFCLVTLYNVLCVELQETIRLVGYIHQIIQPSLILFHKKTSLQILRKKTIVVLDNLI